MRRPLFLITTGGAAAGALIIATALPAAAATSGRAEMAAPAAPAAATPVTFEVTTTGTLSITSPAGPIDLGTGAVGTTIGNAATVGPPNTGNFGAVTVTDNRALNPASWTATVTSTNFVNASTSADVIPAGDATYLTETVGATTGSTLGTTAVSVNDTTTIPLGTGPQNVVTETGFDGDNSTQWTPEIQLNVPATAVLGTYDATITHSVS